MYQKIERVEDFFKSDGQTLSSLFVSPALSLREKVTGLLFIHGSASPGGRGKAMFETFQSKLAQAGFASLSFDTRGVGDSEGDFSNGTLLNRIVDAESTYLQMLQYQAIDPTKIALLGLSMGGHIASRLLGMYPERFNGAILINPAAYGSEAENKKLKPSREFTDTINRENSFVNSPAFEHLKRYQSPIFLLQSELDKVIPKPVQDLYLNSISNLYRKLSLPNSPHTVFSDMTEIADKSRNLIYQETIRFLNDLNI